MKKITFIIALLFTGIISAHPLSVIYFEYLRKGSNNYDPWLTN